jgi:hypothetical protein
MRWRWGTNCFRMREAKNLSFSLAQMLINVGFIAIFYATSRVAR